MRNINYLAFFGLVLTIFSFVTPLVVCTVVDLADVKYQTFLNDTAPYFLVSGSVGLLLVGTAMDKLEVYYKSILKELTGLGE